MCCVKILHLIMIHVEGQIDKSIEMCLLGKRLAELTHINEQLAIIQNFSHLSGFALFLIKMIPR